MNVDSVRDIKPILYCDRASSNSTKYLGFTKTHPPKRILGCFSFEAAVLVTVALTLRARMEPEVFCPTASILPPLMNPKLRHSKQKPTIHLSYHSTAVNTHIVHVSHTHKYVYLYHQNVTTYCTPTQSPLDPTPLPIAHLQKNAS